MALHIREIVEIFPDLLSLFRGDPEHTIADLQAPESATQHSLVFIGDRYHLGLASQTPAHTWVVHKDLKDLVPDTVPHVLLSSNVPLAMSFIAKRFFPLTDHQQTIRGPKIHPTSVISPTARIGEDCQIGPGAVIGDGCEVGDHCIIGANTVIEPGVKIGRKTYLHPLVFVGHHCEIGEECEIHPGTTIGPEGFGYAQDGGFNHHRIIHYGKVIIEDRVHIGAGVQMDRGTFLDSRIGAGTKIDNHCHFGHNIVVGRNTLITAGMITAGSATIGSNCVFGGRTTVGGHLKISDNTRISALSGVSKGINTPGEYGGFPLQDLRGSIKTRAVLRHLPAMFKQLKKIMQHLGMDPNELKDSGE